MGVYHVDIDTYKGGRDYPRFTLSAKDLDEVRAYTIKNFFSNSSDLSQNKGARVYYINSKGDYSAKGALHVEKVSGKNRFVWMYNGLEKEIVDPRNGKITKVVSFFRVSYTKDGYGGTTYSYGDIDGSSIPELRKRLIREGLPKDGRAFHIDDGRYRIIGILTNRQPAYPGIWLWSGNGGWRVVNPKTGRIGVEMTDRLYKSRRL